MCVCVCMCVCKHIDEVRNEFKICDKLIADPKQLLFFFSFNYKFNLCNGSKNITSYKTDKTLCGILLKRREFAIRSLVVYIYLLK